uniref:Uncharacterized protein n=1 Tax=Zea mays TaxID=4577 RepID=C0PEZ6_MAIZE|nr:unknown [Zea mays]
MIAATTSSFASPIVVDPSSDLLNSSCDFKKRALALRTIGSHFSRTSIRTCSSFSRLFGKRIAFQQQVPYPVRSSSANGKNNYNPRKTDLLQDLELLVGSSR